MSLYRLMPLVLVTLASLAAAADYSAVDPTLYGPDDPRTKELPRMMSADVKRRMQAANLRESQAFAAVATKSDWETYRDQRVASLRRSLGTLPETPKDVRVVTTRKLEGDGYVIHNTLYESRPGVWVAANLYLPAKPPEKMPGFVIVHSHHGGKTGGELQDMGMTWARAGAAVLVPDQLGYGERRQHDFNTEQDYPKPYRVSRQDYYFRYNSNLQLSSIGDSLIGWMVWDIMRGVDVLMKQPTIDAKRLILLGSVAGGGDPAAVAAALDPRIACVAPFNFGGWQPESSVLEQPDRDFAWFGDGYWESTRGLRYGARDGFAHFAIVGSIAPRKLIHAHEFAWDAKADPSWPRLQKIYRFYDAGRAVHPVHGSGSVRGRPPESTHCNHIGAVHRKGIHPALQEWFGLAIPEEYSKPRPSAELRCWTKEAREELKPLTLAAAVRKLAAQRRTAAQSDDPRTTWSQFLGDVEPLADAMQKAINVESIRTEDVEGGTLSRFSLETDAGISVPVFLIRPRETKGKSPVVVMISSAGKHAFLKERDEAISGLLKAGVAVCLADLRGTGETRLGTSAERGSSRTSVSQTNLILGQHVLGGQLRDLRTLIRWLRTREGIDGAKLGLWGDSFAKVNTPDVRLAVPLDVETPAICEPGGANLALLAGLFEKDVAAVYARGGLDAGDSLSNGPYLYLPHDAIVPAPLQVSSLATVIGKTKPVAYEGTVDAQNRASGDKSMPTADAAAWLVKQFATR